MWVTFTASLESHRRSYAEVEESIELPDNSTYDEIQKLYEEFVINENQGDWYAYDEFNDEEISSTDFREQGIQLKIKIEEAE